MNDYLLTYFWTGLECLAAVLLFDSFSERKGKRKVRYSIIVCFVFLVATFLNLPVLALFPPLKMLVAIIGYFILHKLIYYSGNLFALYIVVIYYATICCVDNLCYTYWMFLCEAAESTILNNDFIMSLVIHGIIIIVSFIQKCLRKNNSAGKTNWRWYTVPTVLSFINVLLVFFFGTCFQLNQISILPLLVCANFMAVIQIAALYLVSWMERDAHLREESISLQMKAKAQQESIEALCAAYAQQRKLTHDFRAHLDTLDAMLAQENTDANAIQAYIYSLQSEQTNRLLLVNTHHAAIDALLNQKALVARNRNIDIQFRVNDLSAININMADITILISNTLDNAIEACEKLPTEDRQIHVQVLMEEGELFYAVRNRSLPIEIDADRLPTTTKNNSYLHGYGLQNVQTTLKKYNSLYALNYADGWFEFATDMPCTLLS